MIRTGTVQRTTKETDIKVELTLDGAQTSSISTGIGFFDHMLTLLAKHGRFGLVVEAKGRYLCRCSPHCGGYRIGIRSGLGESPWR